jgi:hypothetical protein
LVGPQTRPIAHAGKRSRGASRNFEGGLWLPAALLTTMARAYSNGNGYSSSPYGGSPSHYSYDAHNSRRHDQSILDDLYAGSRSMLARLWRYSSGPGRVAATNFAMQSGQQMRRSFTWSRVLSFPHLLALFWAVVMLWGERWVFPSRVASCDWDHWEKWVSGHFFTGRPLGNSSVRSLHV